MQIRISPDVLRDVAKKQIDIINQIAEENTKLGALTSQLGEAWEGPAGAQAQNAFEEIRTGIKKVIDGAGDCTQKLIGVAEAFESIDSGENVLAIKKFSTDLAPMPLRPTLVLSMSGMVRIDPDRVRDIAEQCKIISTTISENTNAYFESIGDLSNEWEGKSYVKYEEETREVIKALREIEDVMAEFISRIVNAANRYEEIDNSL